MVLIAYPVLVMLEIVATYLLSFYILINIIMCIFIGYLVSITQAVVYFGS